MSIKYKKISSSVIPNAVVEFRGNEKAYVLDALESTWISSVGKYVEMFERQFAQYHRVANAVTVSNGTCALHLALQALKIGHGDEVIVPNFTFAATANAVFHSGATPVLVDSYSDHWNIDPDEIVKVISSRTKAIIPVHLYGQPCDMEKILNIAKKNNLYVIEDAAEAHGAEICGRKVGSLGHIGCFSFYANKIITSGEGGMCITNTPELANRMCMLRDHGMNPQKRYWNDEVGFNYRMTNITAAIGLAQLEFIDEIIALRKMKADLYRELLEACPGVRLIMPAPFGRSVDWLQCVYFESEHFDQPNTIEDFILKLKKAGIDARRTFYPLDAMPPYVVCRRSGDLKNSHWFSSHGVALPLYPLLTEEEIHYIVSTVKAFLKEL